MSKGARLGVDISSGPPARMRFVFLGLSITSSWGNGHATTYRALLRALDARGHEVTFLERDVPWYAENRDLPKPPFGKTHLYASLDELRDRFTDVVREADCVVVGSYVPEGCAVGEWVLATARGVPAFYDIDTPVTLRKLAEADHEYLSPSLAARYRLYLSFTGGPLLERIARIYKAPAPRPLYCAVDPSLYQPLPGTEQRWDLGYLGTYSADRQLGLEKLLLQPSRRWPEGRFAVAGPLYPEDIAWPPNVERLTHVSPGEHGAFYNAQRFTLNITRADMTLAGYSPSVRLFEAAACAVPIISDAWPGLDEFFTPGDEILLGRSSDEVLTLVRELDEDQRKQIGMRARERVLAEHTATHRAVTLERYLQEIVKGLPAGGQTRKRKERTWPGSF